MFLYVCACVGCVGEVRATMGTLARAEATRVATRLIAQVVEAELRWVVQALTDCMKQLRVVFMGFLGQCIGVVTLQSPDRATRGQEVVDGYVGSFLLAGVAVFTCSCALLAASSLRMGMW